MLLMSLLVVMVLVVGGGHQLPNVGAAQLGMVTSGGRWRGHTHTRTHTDTAYGLQRASAGRTDAQQMVNDNSVSH